MAALNYTDLLAGALITAFGAILVMIWDYYKIYKDKIDKEINIINAVDYEITKNIDFAQTNLKLLDQNTNARKTNQETVSPLIPFRNEMWALVKINISKNFLKNEKISDIITISTLIDAINEIIRSRENYRFNGSTVLERYNTRMDKYDILLNEVIAKLVVQLLILRNKFQDDMIIIKADETSAYYEKRSP